MAVLARTMLDFNLADAEPACRRQHRNEAMQLAVQPHFAKYLGPVTFEPTIVIVQRHTGHAADHPIENAARQHLMPGIVADAFPAADHVGSLVHCLEKAWDFLRVVLQVGVKSHDDLAARSLKARRECRGLAEVAAEADAAHARILHGERANHFPGIIGAAVVDEQDLYIQAVRFRRLVDLLMELREAVMLIENRNDNGNHAKDFRSVSRGRIADSPANVSSVTVQASRNSRTTTTANGSAVSWPMPAANCPTSNICRIVSRTPNPPVVGVRKPAT